MIIEGRPWPILGCQPIPYAFTPESTPHDAEVILIHLVDPGQGRKLHLVLALIINPTYLRAMDREAANGRRLLCSFTACAGSYSEVILWTHARHMVDRMHRERQTDATFAQLIDFF